MWGVTLGLLQRQTQHQFAARHWGDASGTLKFDDSNGFLASKKAHRLLRLAVLPVRTKRANLSGGWD